MTKLKKYNTIEAWNNAQGSLKYPSIGYVNKKIKWMNGPTEVGDIAYWDGEEVKCVSKDRWDASLGSPIGVVVMSSRINGASRIIPINHHIGFLLARINVINSTLTFLGAEPISPIYYHSSTAYSNTQT